MFKKASLIFISLLLILTFTGKTNAQFDWLKSPGITPDSPFYFLDKMGEKIGMFFAFRTESKVKKALKYAEERLAEAEAMANENKAEKATKATENYQEQLNMIQNRIQEAKQKGKSVEEVSSRVAQATSNHLAVLEDVLQKVPEEAKPAIERARERSKNGHLISIEAVVEENPQRAAEINAEAIRERLQEAKRQAERNKIDNEVEKILVDYEDFKNFQGKMEEKYEALRSFITEKKAEEANDLDEVEDEIEDISPEMKERIKQMKSEFKEDIKNSLRGIIQENPEKAAQIHLTLLGNKLDQIREKSEDLEEEDLEEEIDEFEEQQEFGREISAIAQELGKDTTTIDELVEQATSIHLKVLSEVYEKAPERAKEAIERAIESSVKGRQRAVESLRKKGIEREEDEVSISEEVPELVRERIKQRVKEEIEREEREEICIQVITPAYNLKTGECKEFSTPCDVPEGWEKGCPEDQTPNPTRKRSPRQ